MASLNKYGSPWVLRQHTTHFSALMASLETEPWISHQTLCGFRKFSSMGEAASEYTLSILASSQKLQNEMNYSFWIPQMNAQRGGSAGLPEVFIIGRGPKEPADVLTDTIKADCVSCFEFLRRIIPELTPLSYNIHGWSILSLTMYHGSIKLLKHFLDQDKGMALHVFQKCFAGQTEIWPTPLSYLPRDRLVAFDLLFECAEKLKDMEIMGKSCVSNAVHAIDRIRFCQFFNRPMASLMEVMGAGIECATISEAHKSYSPFPVGTTSWHAAAMNDYSFADRMAGWSNLLYTSPNCKGELPLHWAIRVQNIETVSWLKNHGAVPQVDIPIDSMSTIWHEAVRHTGKNSYLILELLMPDERNELDKVDMYAIASLFHRLAFSLMDCVLPTAVTTISNEDFGQLRKDLEVEGLKKVKVLWDCFVDVEMPHARAQAATNLYNESILIIRTLGFEYLIFAMREIKDRAKLVPVSRKAKL